MSNITVKRSLNEESPPLVHQRNVFGQPGNEINIVQPDANRYVEGTCIIIGKDEVLDCNIEFILKMRRYQLPFLDLLLWWNQQETDRYQKVHLQRSRACSSNLIYWKLTLSISSEGMVKDTRHIFDVVKLDGYIDLTVSSFTIKRKRSLLRQVLTKLTPDQ